MKTQINRDSKNLSLKSSSIQLSRFEVQINDKKLKQERQIFWEAYYQALNLASFHCF
ncbi:MAG: hypothetical protein AAFO04_17375 [Cyanobacteria bacterium J06592_8]